MSRTVVESPNARFRREAGLSPTVSSRTCAGDWMKMRCGDRVREKGGRHVGRVESIKWSSVVKVRWDNGWISECALDDLERAGKDE